MVAGGADGLAKIFNVQSGKNIGTFVHGKRSEASTSTSNLSLLSVSIAWAAGRKADPWTRGKAKELAKVVAMSLLAIVEASEVEEGEGKRAGKRPDFN